MWPIKACSHSDQVCARHLNGVEVYLASIADDTSNITPELKSASESILMADAQILANVAYSMTI